MQVVVKRFFLLLSWAFLRLTVLASPVFWRSPECRMGPAGTWARATSRMILSTEPRLMTAYRAASTRMA